QGELLMIEINCSRWASALTRLVYEFMERKNTTYGTEPPFKVPNMHYVNVVLAVANNHKWEMYLLEEVISELDGDFWKYINNTAAMVLSQTDPDWQYVGNFLSFTQHIQMLETNERSYTTLRPTNNHLTMKPSDNFSLGPGRVFADGNLAAASKYFGNDHICNEFCEYYELPKISPSIQLSRDPAIIIEQVRKELEKESRIENQFEDGEITEGGRSARPQKRRKTLA
ncbi:hypothetical protein L208DRAFT_1258784, partial [Tricholoma matsutake]